MKLATMRTIKWLAVTAVAAASFAVPASAQGAVHRATASPHLFIYTEPGFTGQAVEPPAITFTRLDGKQATLETHKGQELPGAFNGCTPASICKFLGWVAWAPSPTSMAVGANMYWAKVGNTMVANVTPPYPYTGPGLDFVKTKAGNFWFFCLEYTPYSTPTTPGAIVYLRYSYSKGWEQIPAQLLQKGCTTEPVPGSAG